MMALKRAAMAACLLSPVEASVVAAGSLTSVTAEAPLYDPRLAADGGCDPAGCEASLTRDGDAISLDSRWSCKPDLGVGSAICSITYNLADAKNIDSLDIAMYKGDERTRTMDIYVDNVKATTWTSSGSTTEFENVELGVAGQSIELRGVLGGSDWLSITEVEILVDDDGGGDDAVAVEAGILGTVTTTADLYDTRLGNANGCDPEGCTAELTRDGDLSEASRWSCASSLGGTCSISYDLGVIRSLSELRLVLFKGATRVRTVEVYVDDVLTTTWTSSGTTDGFESIDLSGYSGQYLTVMSLEDDSAWLSIIETEIMVLSDGGEVSTPAPAATPAPATVPPVSTPSPAPGGNLQPVGLLPLALGPGLSLDRFAVKDGDLTTSWTCTGDAREPNDSGDIYYECETTFRLLYYRNIKQVKIALPDGAERSTEMRITGNFDVAETFVTSSGTTSDLETYDYDYKVNVINIAGVFAGTEETISISEVELVEEVVEGEAVIDSFSTPYDNGDGLWDRPAVPGFAWTSDSEEAIGRTLGWGMAGYFTLTEALFQFPVGDTYKFDLELFNGLDGTGEAYTTIPDLESVDQDGWQSFDLTSYADQPVSLIRIVIEGTGSGAPGFEILDANFLGEEVIVTSDSITVGSTMIEYWPGEGYPDFVAEGTSDQHTINAAICAVKKASYDGVDCVGGDDAATGTVDLASDGYYMVDGSVVMKSGVFLAGYYNEDNGIQTYIALEETAAGNADIEAIIVMDGITDASIDELWIRGLYDPETDDGSSGLGPACLSVQNSQNITARLLDARFCDGDVMVVRNSDVVNIDAGRYDEELLAWTSGLSRGTGLIVDSSEDVWVRRHRFYENGVAGLHVSGSTNFTFEATYGGYEDSSQGSVGSLNGQQPIEIIIESSSLLTFTDMRVQSANAPVMTISGSTGVSFTNLGLSSVPDGTCVIETDNPTTVTIDAEEDELELQDFCYVKVAGAGAS